MEVINIIFGIASLMMVAFCGVNVLDPHHKFSDKVTFLLGLIANTSFATIIFTK